MKWPSSSASASRNSAENFLVGHGSGNRRGNAPPSTPVEQALERVKSAAYKAARFKGVPVAVLQSPTQVTGVKMKLIAWAIALAAAGLTPAAAQTPQAAQPQATQANQVTGPAAATAPSERAQGQSLDAANAPAPSTPATANRDRHTGDRDRLRVPRFPRSISAFRSRPARAFRSRSRRSAAAPPTFHNIWLLGLCAIISIFVLGPARLHDAAFPPRREPDAVPHVAQHCARSDLDARPGPDPRRHRDPVDAAAQQAVQPAAGRRDDQGHRQPMVLDLFLPGPRRLRDRFEHAQGKGRR